MFSLLKNPVFRRVFSGGFSILQGGALIGAFFYLRASPYLREAKTLIVQLDQELALAKVITLLGVVLILYRSLGVFFSEGRRLHNFAALPMAIAILISGVILLPLERYASGLGLSLSPHQADTLRVEGVDVFLVLSLVHGIFIALEGLLILCWPGFSSAPTDEKPQKRTRPSPKKSPPKKGGTHGLKQSPERPKSKRPREKAHR